VEEGIVADPAEEKQLLEDLVQAGQAAGRLGENEETFRAALDALRAEDAESFQALLGRLELVDRCELVCRWFCAKECVLLCLELCGPPKVEAEPPDIREFAEVVVRITSDEELVELLAEAVEERDVDSWRELIEKQKLERFCHLLCHWACAVRCRLVCQLVCGPVGVPRRDVIPELQQAGQALGKLVANEEAFGAAVKAVRAGNCEVLRDTIATADLGPYCRIICEWFCSWRCVLVCLPFCRPFPFEPPKSPIREAFEFAQVSGKLAENPDALERLSAVVARGDSDAFAELVKELQLERFCIQLCHWLCFFRCRRFCICVCPPRTEAVFTKIGQLYYDTDISSHSGETGLTVADLRAFYNTLRLNGGISVVDGAPLVEYRFETVPTSPDGTTLANGNPILPGPTPGGSWVPVLAPQIAPTNIGSFFRSIAVFPFFEIIQVWVNKSGPGIFTITPDAEGWIQVPPMFPVPPMVPAGPQWRFFPGADLIQLETETLLPPFVASVDETGVDAGDAPNAPLETDVYFGIRMRLRNVGASGDGSDAGTCNHIAINNTRYNNISHHPYWPGGLFGQSNELAMSSIGIAELAAAPCSTLTGSFTVQFTAAHSNMGTVSVWLEGPGGPYAFDLNPAAAQTPGEAWFGTATPSGWTFASLPPCAYLLKLGVEVLLTTGDPGTNTGTLVDYIAFCKGP